VGMSWGYERTWLVNEVLEKKRWDLGGKMRRRRYRRELDGTLLYSLTSTVVRNVPFHSPFTVFKACFAILKFHSLSQIHSPSLEDMDSHSPSNPVADIGDNVATLVERVSTMSMPVCFYILAPSSTCT
jgi:hypothetical protein